MIIYVIASVVLVGVALLIAYSFGRGWRWLVLIGLAVIGLLLLVPLKCQVLTMPMCESGDCTLSVSTSCTTVAGLSVPFAQAVGSEWARVVGAVIVVVAVGVGLLVGRHRDRSGSSPVSAR